MKRNGGSGRGGDQPRHFLPHSVPPAVPDPAPGADLDPLEKLKRRLLNRWGIAYVVLGAIVLAFLVALGKDLLELSRDVRPRVVITIKPESQVYALGEGQTLDLRIQITAESKEPTALNDVVFALSFEKRDQNGDYQLVPAPDDDRAFRTDASRIRVGTVETRTGVASVTQKVLCKQSGEYRLILSLYSGSALIASNTAALTVRPSTITQLLDRSDAKHPVLFATSDGVVDAKSASFADVDDFRILFPAEEQAVSAPRATLWLETEYLGSCGGLCFNIYGYLGRYEKITEGNDSKENPYVQFVLKPLASVKTQLRLLDSLGPASGPVIVPVGASLYRGEMVDADRMVFTNVTRQACREIEGVRSDLPAEGAYTTVTKWSFKDVALDLVARYSCGATGRNCWTEVDIGGDTYEVVEHGPGEPSFSAVETDFPVLKETQHRYISISAESANDVHVLSCSREAR